MTRRTGRGRCFRFEKESLTMIADLDETLRQLLVAELPVKNGEIDIKFDQPRREWSARLTKPTINLFLYDVRENTTLRQHQWEMVKNGRGPAGSRKRTPFRIDCHYMLTTWAAQPEDEHRLLTRAMLVLFRFPVLTEDRLVGAMRDQPFDVAAQLAVADKLTNPAEVWSALDNEMRPTVPYLVTIALDPWTEVTGPIVRTFTLRTGQTRTLPWQQQLDEVAAEVSYVAGIVHKNGAPQPGIEIAIKGTGLLATSDGEGRFSLGGLPPGTYTLLAWPASGKPKQKQIIIPAAGGDYDIEL